MEEIITELSGNVLRVQFNRPSKKNAMTAAMYAALAEELDRADKNEDVRVVLVHGAGDSFTAGNDLADFTSHPPGPGDSPQGSIPQFAHSIQQTADCSRARRRNRGRHDNASAFRLCLCRGRHKISDPVYQPRARTRTGVKLHAAEADWIPESGRVDFPGRAIQCGSRKRGWPRDGRRSRSKRLG
jgi:hypothetical protein